MGYIVWPMEWQQWKFVNGWGDNGLQTVMESFSLISFYGWLNSDRSGDRAYELDWQPLKWCSGPRLTTWHLPRAQVPSSSVCSHAGRKLRTAHTKLAHPIRSACLLVANQSDLYTCFHSFHTRRFCCPLCSCSINRFDWTSRPGRTSYRQRLSTVGTACVKASTTARSFTEYTK